MGYCTDWSVACQDMLVFIQVEKADHRENHTNLVLIKTVVNEVVLANLVALWFYLCFAAESPYKLWCLAPLFPPFLPSSTRRSEIRVCCRSAPLQSSRNKSLTQGRLSHIWFLLRFSNPQFLSPWIQWILNDVVDLTILRVTLKICWFLQKCCCSISSGHSVRCEFTRVQACSTVEVMHMCAVGRIDLVNKPCACAFQPDLISYFILIKNFNSF